jgi:hypothetical protein
MSATVALEVFEPFGFEGAIGDVAHLQVAIERDRPIGLRTTDLISEQAAHGARR